MNTSMADETPNTSPPATTDAARRGQVVTSAAVVYEQTFVPALFGQFAPIALARAGVGAGDRVLDVASGTGIVARTAAAAVGPEGRVVGVDINPAMLNVARRLESDVEWIEAPAESLPLSSDFFDAVVCQFGLMFFTDVAAALDEMARVVRPGRALVISTWADATASPGYSAMIELLDDEIGIVAGDSLRAPFTIGTHDALSALLAPAFDRHEVWTQPGTARFSSLDDWLKADLRGWTLAESIDDEVFASLLASARSRLAEFVEPSGVVAFDAPAIMAVASAGA